ncbi:thiol:disulfide interchange protein DsbA/DsbL [Kitasatospora sp. NPDC002040]|uniref:thiol:disulfide interchange protein DsbA/DsbL n=1 Tax=Kitasatospora sp. NPDC002040 TaxID=3154661 RepID=UPI00331D82C9
MKPLLRTAVLAAVASGLLVTPAAAAPEVPHDGGLVGRIDHPGPVRAVKQEAVEFFWYDCGHSQELELPLERWAEKHRADVTLRRVPAVWVGSPEEQVQRGHARLFYTLEQLGQVDRLQLAVFRAVRERETDVTTEETATAWALTAGLDPDAFRAAYRSHAVEQATEAAGGLMTRYRVDELPTVLVQGERVRPSRDGGVAGMPAALDRLVD